jgi:transcription-repair coupling factor (superfamily II helicase)
MALYKRVSQLRSAPSIDSLSREIRDRYGPLPAEVDRLLSFCALRVRAEALGILQADVSSGSLHLRFGETPLAPEALVSLVPTLAGAALSPQGLRVPLPAGAGPLEALEALLGRLEAAAPAPSSAL